MVLVNASIGKNKHYDRLLFLSEAVYECDLDHTFQVCIGKFVKSISSNVSSSHDSSRMYTTCVRSREEIPTILCHIVHHELSEDMYTSLKRYRERKLMENIQAGRNLISFAF